MSNQLMDKRVSAAKVWADVRAGVGLLVEAWVIVAMVVTIASAAPLAIVVVRAAWRLM